MMMVWLDVPLLPDVLDDDGFTDGYVYSGVTNAARSDTLFQLGLQGILLSDYGHDDSVKKEIRNLWSEIHYRE